MKYLYLLLTIVVESVLVWLIEASDIPINIFFVLFMFLSIAIIFRVLYKNLKYISWGLFYGSFITLLLGIGYLLYIMFLFRNIAD